MFRIGPQCTGPDNDGIGGSPQHSHDHLVLCAEAADIPSARLVRLVQRNDTVE
jgi:hypothetical protein